jgi:hypothetical protein
MNIPTCQGCDSEFREMRPVSEDPTLCIFCWIAEQPPAFQDFEVSIGTPDGWMRIS